MINLTPEEYFSELGRLRKEFPELSKAALIQMMDMLYNEEENDESIR